MACPCHQCFDCFSSCGWYTGMASICIPIHSYVFEMPVLWLTCITNFLMNTANAVSLFPEFHIRVQNANVVAHPSHQFFCKYGSRSWFMPRLLHRGFKMPELWLTCVTNFLTHTAQVACLCRSRPTSCALDPIPNILCLNVLMTFGLQSTILTLQYFLANF